MATKQIKKKPQEENFDDIDNYDPSLEDPSFDDADSALDAEFEKEIQEEQLDNESNTNESDEENIDDEKELDSFEKEVKKVEKKKTKTTKKKTSKKNGETKKRKPKKQKEEENEKTDKEDLESFKVPKKSKEIDADYLDTIITRKATEKVDVPKIDEIE